MGFLRNQNAAPAAPTVSAEEILAATQNPGMGQAGGDPMEAIIAAGNYQPPQAPQGNFLQQLGGGAEAAAPRQRMSTLDIIGRIADTFAQVGGADPLYRQNQDREREIGRQTMDDSWKEKFNVQKLTAGENELQQAGLQKYGQASRGLNAVFRQSGAPGVQKAWPMIAKQLGFSPEETQIFGEQLSQDPETALTALDEGLNASGGSQPKEVAILRMLEKRDPTGKLAQEYVGKLTSSELNPYQAAQIQLRQADDARDARRDRRDQYESNRDYRLRVQEANRKSSNDEAKAPDAGRREAAESARGVLTEFRDAYNRLREAGGINDKGQGIAGRAGAFAMQNIPLAERMLSPEGFSAREDLERLRTTGLQSLLPLLGGIKLGGKNIDAAKELETWRKAIASASDYPSAMRALNGFERRINEITREPAPARRGSSGSQPRQTLKPKPNTGGRAAGGWGKATVVN